MIKYHVRSSVKEDYCNLQYLVRQKERDEIMASSAMYPYDALKRDFELSRQCFTAFADGEMLAMFGVIPLSLTSDKAVPWMITTDELPKHKRFLLVGSRRVIKYWNSTYPLLFNFIDARYNESLNWARHVGFTVYDPEPFGSYSLPFHRIESRVE